MLSHIRRAQPPTNPLNGVYFTQPPRRNPAARVLVSGSGMTKPSKRTFKAPAHLTQHRAAARRPEEEFTATRRPTPRQRGGRHATGPVSAHRRGGIFRAPTYERDWRPSCIVRRSSPSSVVSGERTAIRVTTAVSSLLELRLLVDKILMNSEDHYSTPKNHTIAPYFQNFAGEVACCEHG